MPKLLKIVASWVRACTHFVYAYVKGTHQGLMSKLNILFLKHNDGTRICI